MSGPTFKIVFHGEIAQGASKEQVKTKLQRLCQLSPTTIERIFSGKGFVLKSGLDAEAAKRFSVVIATTGAICTVVPVPADGTPDSATGETAAVISPPPLPTKARAAKQEQLTWLHQELPYLVETGLLDAEAAARIGSHYEPLPKEPRKTPLALILCAGLGSLLVGLGIILIFAHNWAEFGRPARTFLSFAPLVLAQLLAALAIGRHPDSTAWQEGAATFLLAAVGSSIALIGQTYHISGDLPRFLLVWMLLGLPLIYLMRAAVPAGLYWVGITAWMGSLRFDGQPVSLYWLLVFLPAPFLWRLWKEGNRPIARSWLVWVLALCLPLAVAFAQRRFENRMVFGTFALLFALYYLADRLWLAEDQSLKCRPLLIIGSLGITLIGLGFSFTELWREIGMGIPLTGLYRLLGFNLTTGLLLGNLLLLGILLRRTRNRSGLLFGLSGLFIFFFQLLGGHLPGAGSVIVFNLFLLLLGAGTLVAGVREGLTSRINGGLGIIALLIIARFFDTDLPFTAKGIAFIAVGGSFLLANIIIKRREGAA